MYSNTLQLRKLILPALLSRSVEICAQIVAHSFFRWFIIATIVFAGVIIGIETYPPLATRYSTALAIIDKFILAIFVLEIVFKVIACGRQPLRFFRDSWNVFDFIIVVVCFLPFDTKFVYVMRLVRILRVLRLITALPRLQVVIGALLRSVPSVGYVSALLLILFYIYAVIGVHLFGSNDPMHFANLYVSLHVAVSSVDNAAKTGRTSCIFPCMVATTMATMLSRSSALPHVLILSLRHCSSCLLCCWER